MRNFLRFVPFVLCSLLSPDLGGGGGGSPAPDAAAPEPTGNTLEEKIASAKSIIGNFFKQVTQLTSDLAAKVKAYTTLEGQFNDLKTTAETEQKAHVTTKGLLDTEKTEHTKTSGKLAAADANVTRLESLCKLKGIDSAQAVPPTPAPAAKVSAASFDARIKAEKDPIARGKIVKEFEDAVAAGTVG